MSTRTAVETRLLSAAMGLPERVQRRIARPLALDGQELASDLQMMLLLQRLARKSDLGRESVAVGRAAMAENAGIVGGRQPIGAVRDLTVAGLPARHYRPSSVPPSWTGATAPVLLYFHGGGFLYGDLESHDAPCRLLAERSGVPVLAIAYRVGPEAPFPDGFDDAEAALRWVIEHAGELGVDPARIGVGGDSAGACIAGAAAIGAARDGIPLAFQLLVYPCTDPNRETESLRLFGDGLYLTRESVDHFNDVYVPEPEQRVDPRIRLLGADLPDGLAPAYVATAGFDVLRDEGEAYARRLAEAGVDVELRRYVDQIHGFLNIVGVGRSSRAAVLEIADRLRAGLGTRSSH